MVSTTRHRTPVLVVAMSVLAAAGFTITVTNGHASEIAMADGDSIGIYLTREQPTPPGIRGPLSPNSSPPSRAPVDAPAQTRSALVEIIGTGRSAALVPPPTREPVVPPPVTRS